MRAAATTVVITSSSQTYKSWPMNWVSTFVSLTIRLRNRPGITSGSLNLTASILTLRFVEHWRCGTSLAGAALPGPPCRGRLSPGKSNRSCLGPEGRHKARVVSALRGCEFLSTVRFSVKKETRSVSKAVGSSLLTRRVP